MNEYIKCGVSKQWKNKTGHKKEWSSDLCYSVSEPWEHSKWKKPNMKRFYLIWSLLYKISRIGKSADIECNVGGCQELGEENEERLFNRVRFSFGVIKRDSGFDIAGGCTTPWMHWIPLTWALKMVHLMNFTCNFKRLYIPRFWAGVGWGHVRRESIPRVQRGRCSVIASVTSQTGWLIFL